MVNFKKGFYGVLMAMSILAVTVFSQFSIQELIKSATGWQPPQWVAVAIAGLGCAGAIVAIVASCGVTLPMWVAVAASGMSSIAA